MQGRMRAGFSLLILLAALSMAGRIVAGQMGPGTFHPAHRLHSVNSNRSQHAAHSSRPMADDSLNHFSAALQTFEILPLSTFLLTLTLFTIPGVERDLLSLTQRRRE